MGSAAAARLPDSSSDAEYPQPPRIRAVPTQRSISPPPLSLSTETTAERPVALSTARLGAGLRKPHNWLQLGKFCAVGASGYVVNLAIFAIFVGPLDQHHLVAATAAFLVAVTNNFVWNHYWTFGSPDGRKRFQALRFFAVSVVAFLFGAAILELLVTLAGVPELAAQAIAIVCATPLNFVGNKLWSFRGW